MDIVEYKVGNSLELANRMWFQRARWVLKAIFTSGVGLKFAYINGLAYNQAFINEFGLKAFLFSFADSELYVGAYMAAVYGLSGWVEFVLGSFLPLLTICGTVSLVWFAPHILRQLEVLVRWSGLHKPPTKRRIWLEKVAHFVSANTIAIMFFIYLPVILLVALMSVSGLGHYAGTRAAAAKKAVYERGCEAAAEKKEFCYVLMDKGSEVARGFPIVRGEKTIALWWKGKVRIEETDGRSLQTLTEDR
ncbi:hypothetical protein QTN24_04730 [Cupriavidus sp. SZY C1]|uniref:hypothetical protein n=1 Tax=Cupriavidus sp. SZY C1 TaxID=3055037 RepID=UPI0028B29B93|nr:hypothetical protein [Cupriavidus sp. SZY C1]MDT6960793.1 hypothetical protein [Cupriavidus sp. SZY C1]